MHRRPPSPTALPPFRFWLGVFIAIGAAAPPAYAQSPKPGETQAKQLADALEKEEAAKKAAAEKKAAWAKVNDAYGRYRDEAKQTGGDVEGAWRDFQKEYGDYARRYDEALKDAWDEVFEASKRVSKLQRKAEEAGKKAGKTGEELRRFVEGDPDLVAGSSALDEAKNKYFKVFNESRDKAQAKLKEEWDAAEKTRAEQPKLPPNELPPTQRPGVHLEEMSLPPAGDDLIAQTTSGGGFYVGLFAGGVVQQPTSLWSANPPGFGFDADPLDEFADTLGLDPPGVIGGGQIGYDTKITFDGGGTSVSLIIGGVADIAGTTGDVTRTAPFPSLGGGLFPIQKTFSSSFVTTERLRVGFKMPVGSGWSVTPYATGGLAVAQVNFSDSMFFPTSFNRGSWSEFRPGWAVGGGVDIKPADWPVTIQVQYLHTDFGDIDYVAPNSAFPLSFIATHHTFTQDRATIGINMSFNRLSGLFGSLP